MQSVDADRVLAAAAAGNDIAWSRIVDSNLDSMWRVARSGGLSDVDAAEVCQLAWLRLSQRLPEFASSEQVARFLIDTVRREGGALAAQRMEQERRRAGGSLPDNVVLLAPGFAGVQPAQSADGAHPDIDRVNGATAEPSSSHAVAMRPIVGATGRNAEAGNDPSPPADVWGQTSAPPR